MLCHKRGPSTTDLTTAGTDALELRKACRDWSFLIDLIFWPNFELSVEISIVI